jgi:hypothetical protein
LGAEIGELLYTEWRKLIEEVKSHPVMQQQWMKKKIGTQIYTRWFKYDRDKL